MLTRNGSVKRRRRGEGPARGDAKLMGIAAARWVRGIAFGQGDLVKAAYFVEKVYDDDLGDEIHKAMVAGELTAGGALVPPEVAAEIIELLRSETVVRAAGARTVPMPNGTLTMRRQTAGSSASYVGESEDISVTQPDTGLLTLTSKKLAAIVPISNELLKFTSGPSADEFVRDDLVQEIAIREDQAFIRDDGTENTPKGLRYWANANNIISQTGDPATPAEIEDDFKNLMNLLTNADVRMRRPVWFMHPRELNHLKIQRNAAGGQLLYPELRTGSPTIHNWPVFVTTSIPSNLNPDGDESEVYLVEMMDAIIGEVSGLEIVANASASYVENATMKSAFSRDETLIRAITMHDFAVRHTVSVAVLTGVNWGA
jgi:HK97 family phage major capsid protein